MGSLLTGAEPACANPTQADIDARLSRAYAAIDEALATSSMPGLVVGVTDRHQLRKVLVHGFADLKAHTPLTSESRLAIGSISKAFTSIALMQLAEEGRFDPRAPITRYLPALKANPRLANITGHHLMTHTAGLPNYLEDAASSRYAMVALQGFEPSYAPGAHWWYSNTGYQLLGYVLENIEGIPYHAIIRRRVLDRLGMTATSAVIDDAQRTHMVVSYTTWPSDGSYVEAPWFEYTAGDGSIVSNAADMCAYLRFILNRGSGPKGLVLPEKAFATLTRPVLEDYAYGLFVRQENGDTVISHSGGIAGFSSWVEAHMGDGFGLVFLSNGGIDTPLREWIEKSLVAAYRGQALPAPPAPTQHAKRARPRVYAGTYQLVGSDGALQSDAVVKFVESGDGLAVAGDHGSLPLQWMATDTFRTSSADSDGFAYYFSRSGGKDSEVVEVSHGSRWYVRKDLPHEARSAMPAEYAAYVGHYQNDGPEGPVMRVFVRDGRLMMLRGLGEWAEAEPLEPLGAGVFRAGNPDYSPERARFDPIVDGRALRLVLTGVPLYRKETP
ncbi:MAG: beta-lactamase family protein [Proteobacteria bacterium]|nr:beta-lactamase family protein [Pseudomonadota bacterium]